MTAVFIEYRNATDRRTDRIGISISRVSVLTREKTQEKSLEFTINRTLMKLSRTMSSDVIRECRCFFGITDTKVLIVKRKMKFLRKYCSSENNPCKLFADAASLEYKISAI